MTRPHTLVIDTSVIIHQIDNSMEANSLYLQRNSDLYRSVLAAQLHWLASADWLGPAKGTVDQVVFAIDVKPYWRTEYLLQPEVLASLTRKTKRQREETDKLVGLLKDLEDPNQFPANSEYLVALATAEELAEGLKIVYKGGRKKPTAGFTKLKKDVYKVLADKGLTLLSLPTFEADDMAASVVKLNRERLADGRHHNITLATIDNDWLGLLGPEVRWFDTKGYYPRLRNSLETVNVWARRKHNRDYKGRKTPPVFQPLTSYEEIWTRKVAEGDRSDNLPPGSPLGVIHLLEPAKRPWDNPLFNQTVINLLERPTLVDMPSGHLAAEFLSEVGIDPCIRTFDPDNRDVYRG